MFLLIIAYGYILVAGLLIYFIARDRKKPNLFFNRNKLIGGIFIIIFFVGILTALYATLIEPYLLVEKKIKIQNKKLDGIKIAFVSDIQVGMYKKTGWSKRVAEKINTAQPNIVIFGGDMISNEGTFEDESEYLLPLQILNKYSVYYVLGNHEYGIGGTVIDKPEKYTGDRSDLVIDRFNDFGFKLLKNSLNCLEIKNQKICLFGLAEIWKSKPNFTELNNWDKNTPLIFVTHNPDGILEYPTNLPYPDLTLAGHTHGGQVWIPFFGPLAKAQTILQKEYYRGLNYFNKAPIYTSVGAGESGTSLRFFAIPEVVIIEFTK